MHRCLLIQEVQQFVYNELDDDESRWQWHQSTRKTQLFAMARTCRAFRDIALENLWRSIPNIVPIIKCAAGDIVWETRTGDMAKELHLAHPFSTAQIAKMSKYASFVRQYGYGQSPEVSVSTDADIWKQLQHIYRETILFPKLRSVYLGNLQSMEIITLFSIQRLISLRVSLPNSTQLDDIPSAQDLTLVNLSARSFNFTTVLLEAFAEAGPNSSKVAVFQPTLTILRLFTCHSSSLQHIEFARSTLPETTFQKLPSLDVSVPVSPILKNMPICFDKFFHVIPLINYLTSTGNMKLRISNSKSSLDDIWTNLSQSAKKNPCLLDGLYTRESACGDYTSEVPHSRQVPMPFQILTRLVIYHFGGYELNDDLLDNITKGLPRLKYLSLIDYSTYLAANMFKIKLLSLQILAKNCPQLSELDIGFDARSIPHEVKPYAQGLNLKELFASTSPVYSTLLAAVRLIQIFPNLKHVWGDGPIGEVPAGEPWLRWSEVNEDITSKAVFNYLDL